MVDFTVSRLAIQDLTMWDDAEFCPTRAFAGEPHPECYGSASMLLNFSTSLADIVLKSGRMV
jgi:hypothetical protein